MTCMLEALWQLAAHAYHCHQEDSRTSTSCIVEKGAVECGGWTGAAASVEDVERRFWMERTS
jgi:hypothetical protein